MSVALPGVITLAVVAGGAARADVSVRPSGSEPARTPIPHRRPCSYDDSPNVKRPRARDPLLEAAHATARVVDREGRTLGLLRLERLASGTTVTSLLDAKTFAPRWRVDGIHMGDTHAAVLAADGQLVVASFHFASTGSRLFALDLATGTPRWIADVEQLNAAHSEYFNDVTVEREGEAIVMRGYEAAGCYVQRFDWRSGRRLSSVRP